MMLPPGSPYRYINHPCISSPSWPLSCMNPNSPENVFPVWREGKQKNREYSLPEAVNRSATSAAMPTTHMHRSSCPILRPGEHYTHTLWASACLCLHTDTFQTAGFIQPVLMNITLFAYYVNRYNDFFQIVISIWFSSIATIQDS